MQDFRRRPSPYTSGLDNISITPFISQLYKFLSKGLGLESHPLFLSSFLTHFDFTPNDNDVRLIWSVKPLPKSTGFVGASQNVEGGGMYVLAQAVKDLSHLRGGDWTIECGVSGFRSSATEVFDRSIPTFSGIVTQQNRSNVDGKHARSLQWYHPLRDQGANANLRQER